MNKKLSRPNIDGIVLFFAFILANLRASIFVHLFPDTSVLLGPAWLEIAFWFITLLLMAYNLLRNNGVYEYGLILHKNWLVILFVLLAFASIFWSVDPISTAFRVLELLFATLMGLYIGIRYRPAQLMELLFWFGAIILILSIALVFAAPKAGTMYWPPFDGAWRGVFWHRNHLASITALLGVVFLCRAVLAFGKKDGRGVLDVVLYFLSLLVLFFAKSATGYILFLSLNFLFVCIGIWLKVHQNLRAQHYYLIGGGFGAGLALILLNLGIVFGLFHRNTSLTGRVGLWDVLLNQMAARHPWLGYGFGAVWTLDSFREKVRLLAGWPSQPLIGDNGFLDILLHLGVVGLVLVIGVVVVAFVRSFRYAVFRKRLEDFFPFLFMCYVLIANIPFSLLAETEVFVWCLMIAVLFMMTPSLGGANELGGQSGRRQKLEDYSRSKFLTR